jgi:TPR repeat protein
MTKLFAIILWASMLVAADNKYSANEAPPQFKDSANLNDERVKVFMETETKAKAGEIEAIKSLGDYYFNGSFPVNKNETKAEYYWTMGAELSSEDCAERMYRHFNKGYESEAAIERTKWAMIHHNILLVKKVRSGHFIRPKGVSESSFIEAEKRAKAFAIKPSPGSVIEQDTPAAEKEPIKFGNIELLRDNRRKICADYRKAESFIYSKGDAASQSEKRDFTKAATELAHLQAYIGKERPAYLNASENQ